MNDVRNKGLIDQTVGSTLRKTLHSLCQFKQILSISLLILGVFVSTLSNAQGRIQVVFNQSVDNTVSSSTDAETTSNIQDSIIAYINGSNTTLDVCNYNTSRGDIVNAINDAYDRGVTVRYIASKDVPFRNSNLDDLNANIPILQRSGGLPGSDEMHNKFIVIDANSTNSSYSISGSLNHTNSSIEDDYNNIVIIQDKDLALAYQTEFNEMWGSSGNAPDLANVKFGPDKTDNTQHVFSIDGITVELYFSPSDQVSTKVKQKLQTADHSIYVAMLTFKDETIANEIINVHNNGGDCKVLLENDSGSSEFSSLQNAGVETYLNDQSGVLHHKYAIIDAHNVNSDPMVITGSQNWNDNTEPEYDDNTLIIHDYEIAQQYLEEFGARWSWSSVLEAEYQGFINKSEFSIFPNPATEILNVQSSKNDVYLDVFDLEGRAVLQEQLDKSHQVDISKLKPGIYQAVFTTPDAVKIRRIVKR